MPRDVGTPDEPLALLLLPRALEGFELEAHARRLLSIPRVIAVEPGRVRTPRFMRDAASLRQARRLSLPGLLRVVVLYHPAQYPLARGLGTVHEDAELWYVPPELGALGAGDEAESRELHEFDELVHDRAQGVLRVAEGVEVDDEALYDRLHELGVISTRPFVPSARFRGALRRG